MTTTAAAPPRLPDVPELIRKIRALEVLSPVLGVGTKRALGGEHRPTLMSSRPPVSLDIIILMDKRWPHEYVDPTKLPVLERPYGITVTTGLWAAHIDLLMLDAGDTAEPQLPECPGMAQSCEFLANTGIVWLAEHEPRDAYQLQRTVSAMLGTLARLIGESDRARTAYRPRCRNCGWRVDEAPHGWTCPACGDEVLLSTELERLAEPLLTASELALRLGVPERSLRRWCADGLIPARGKRGNARLYDLATAEAVVRWGGVQR